MSLGKIAGGDVVSIDFNFQTSSEPSSASLSVVSKNGIYPDLSLGSPYPISCISLENAPVQMILKESREQIGGTSATLQLEFVDKSYILDKILVLVRGIHSANSNNISGASEASYNISGLPADYFPPHLTADSLGAFKLRPAHDKAVTQISKNTFIIGRIRAVFTPDTQIASGSSSFDPSVSTDFHVVFDNGSLRADLSRIPAAFSSETSLRAVITQNLSAVSKEQGWTLSDLSGVLTQTGFIIRDSNNILSDDKLLFSESGSLRSCLSSAGGRFGFSFFYDIWTNSIIIVSENEIKAMNKEIEKVYSDYLDGFSDAKEIRRVRSIGDSVGRYSVFKSVFNPKEKSGGDSREGPKQDRNRRTPFSSFDIFGAGNSVGFDDSILSNLFFIFRYNLKNPEELFDKVILYDVYKGLDMDYTELWPFYKVLTSAIDPDDNEVFHADKDVEPTFLDDCLFGKQIRTSAVLKKSNPLFYDEEETFFAQYYSLNNVSGSIESGSSGIKEFPFQKPSETGVYNLMKAYLEKCIGGFYISRGFSRSETEKMTFNDETFEVSGPHPLNRTVSEIDAFSDIASAISGTVDKDSSASVGKYERWSNLTVRDLLLESGVSEEDAPDLPEAGTEGDRFYYIAFRKVSLPKEGSFKDKSVGSQDLKEAREKREEIEIALNNSFADFLEVDGKIIAAFNAAKKEKANDVLADSRKEFAAYKKYLGIGAAEDTDNQWSYDLWKKEDEPPSKKVGISFTKTYPEGFGVEEGEEGYTELPEIVSVKHLEDSSLDLVLSRDISFIESNELNASRLQELTEKLNGKSAGITYTVEATLPRAPTAADFYRGTQYKGLDSLSISAGDNGISTNIRYSTRKYLPVDMSVLLIEGQLRRIRGLKGNAVAKNFLKQ